MRNVVRLSIMLLLLTLLVACLSEDKTSATTSANSCKGIYYERDSFGVLKKYNQYDLNGQCYTDNMPLSRYETTLEKWTKDEVQCVPQPGFASRTLVAANNFYSYRDGKAFLQFDSNTGIYRRIILAEGRTGGQVYSKLQGCFYQRTGAGVDASFGTQLLLDTDVSKIVTSQHFDPFEIYSYTQAGTDINMLRFDDTRDYDFRNCPYLNTPWQFCTLLRDGNEMFFPILTAQQMADLRDEAIIILRQFNWSSSSKAAFDSLWDSIEDSRTEAVREGYLYDVIHVVDTPRFIDQAWRDYLIGVRPTMPDVNSNTDINLCYQGSKNVTLSDGSTGKIYGEICYIDGVYTFTPN